MKLYLKAAIVIVVSLGLAGCFKSLGPVTWNPDSHMNGEEQPDGEPGFGEVSDNGEPAPEITGEGRPAVDGDSETRAGAGSHSSEQREEIRKRKAQQVLDEALEFCQASQDFWGQGDFENAIDSLDQAYNLILEVDTNDNVKLIQQKEDIRFMISKRILEIYASRHIVAKGNHNVIPMVMNQHIEKEIKSFQGPEREFFIASYKRSGRYRPEILKALRDAGLPKELSWLPLIESGFKVRALSRARALGLWQFIPSTGYKFGLKRDEWIDERMDVAKSTRAAIDYLKELHNIFGDWMTVLAGYNCGEAKVLSIIRTQNINYLDNFWDVYEKLPWETARYVPRFLAVLFIINTPQEYGFDLPEADLPQPYETITVSKQMLLENIAQEMKISSEVLCDLNAELRHKATPGEQYELKVPEGAGMLLLAGLDRIPTWTAPQPPPQTAPQKQKPYLYHRVRGGETLSCLAERYKTTVRAISSANNIGRSGVIKAGQRLKIPVKGARPAITHARRTTTPVASKPVYHYVERGDSVWLLARKYNTTTDEIMRLNNLNTTSLYIGQKLAIPKGTQVVEKSEDTKAYEVKAGDSPYEIARNHQMKLERFLRMNDLTPLSKIYPGQVLRVELR